MKNGGLGWLYIYSGNPEASNIFHSDMATLNKGSKTNYTKIYQYFFV